MENRTKLLLSSRYPYFDTKTIDLLAEKSDILDKSVVDFDPSLDSLSITGYKVVDLSKLSISDDIDDDSLQLMRAKLPYFLSISNEPRQIDSKLKYAFDTLFYNNGITYPHEKVNFLFDHYNNINIEEKSSKRYSIEKEAFFEYFSDFLGLRIEDVSLTGLINEVSIFQVLPELETIRKNIVADLNANVMLDVHGNPISFTDVALEQKEAILEMAEVVRESIVLGEYDDSLLEELNQLYSTSHFKSISETKYLLHLPELEKNEKIATLLDEVYENIKHVDFLKNGLFTPFAEGKSMTLEIDSSYNNHKILLEFDIHENMDSRYLVSTIAEEMLMNYEFDSLIDFQLRELVDNHYNLFIEEAKNMMNPLKEIAYSVTGANGLSPEVDKEFIDEFCNFEYGSVDIKRYLEDIIEAYLVNEIDHSLCVEILEITYQYCEAIEIDVLTIKNFEELHMYVLEDTMFELTSGTTEYLNLNLEYNIDNFSEDYKKVFTKYSDHVMTKIYGNYIENLDLTKVYCFQEDSVHLWGEYKFINIENTVCLANVNWYDFSKHTDLDINDLRAHLEWFEEEYEESYSHQLRVVDEIDKGNIPSYLTSTGIRQDLNDILEKLVPKNSQCLNTNLNCFLDEKTMKNINESISMKHVLVDMRIMSSPNQIQLEQQYTQALEKCEVNLKYINDCIGYANDELGKICKSNDENILDKLENVCSNIFKNNDRNTLNTLLDLNRNDRFRLGVQTQLNVESKHLGDNTKLFLKATSNSYNVNLDQRLEKPKMKLKL